MKDGLDGVTVGTFTLESITVGKTKKGKDISSATVLWSDAPAFTKTAQKQKAPTPQQAAMLNHITQLSLDGPLLFRLQCRLLRAKPTTSRPQVGAWHLIVARQRHPCRQRDISAVELRQLGAERLHVLDVGIS